MKNNIFYRIKKMCQVLAYETASPKFVSKIFPKLEVGYRLD